MTSGAHDLRLRCARCGDVIGIYEPVVLVEAHGPRQTSCAAEPELTQSSRECFHRDCHGGPLSEHNGSVHGCSGTADSLA